MPTINNGIKIGKHMTDEDRAKLKAALGTGTGKGLAEQLNPVKVEEPVEVEHEEDKESQEEVQEESEQVGEV